MSQTRSRGSLGWSGDWTARVTEPTAARRRRLKQEKARRDDRALEVDRSGSLRHLERAAKRLRHADAYERVLCVQHWNLEKAMEAMRRAGVEGLVTNLCASELRPVSTKRRFARA